MSIDDAAPPPPSESSGSESGILPIYSAPRPSVRLRAPIPTRRKLAYAAALALGPLLVGEGIARVYERVAPPASWSLDAYEVPYRTLAGTWSWKPRPGYVATTDRVLQEKLDRGATVGARLLEQWRAEGLIAPDADVLEIDAHGFKGPAVATPKPADRVRLLCVGDSCTFGAWADRYSYPRAMERALRARLGTDRVEVVNGGCEGYHTAHALWRLPDYRAVEPDIVTILIGWNEMFEAENLPPALWPHGRAGELAKSSALARVLARAVVAMRRGGGGGAAPAATTAPAATSPSPGGEKATGGAAPSAEPAPAPPPAPAPLDRVYDAAPSPITESLAALEPAAYRARLRALVEAFEAMGARVVLLTLPGIAAPGIPDAALGRAHWVPLSTRNVYHTQLITRRYDAVIREVAAEREGRVVIDLAAWAEEQTDRFDMFSDSVHLTPEAQAREGEWLAERLAPLVRERLEAR